MVSKLNDMLTAAVVADSAAKTGSSANVAPKIEAKQPSAMKVPTVKDVQAAKDEEKKEKEQAGRLEPGTMSEESVSEMTDTFNELMDKINCDVEFKYNKKVNMLNVKMIDKESGEVIKEFPPEEMIENMIKAKDWLGAFIDRAI
ncbi:MAG: flagellar protein FlaG [Selenomonadaceae bacterium]|nr:flagellar protein FlaG [Selenomonadaceae bacterium]